jgi:hypothetical protein
MPLAENNSSNIKSAFNRCDECGARTQCDVTYKTTPPTIDVMHLYNAPFRTFCYNFWQYCKKILHDHIDYLAGTF